MATVEWTEDGREFVEGREYLYLSPVFLFDADTGEVQSLHSVALTNTPALNSLGEIAAMAALAALADQDDFYRAEHSPLMGRETSLRSFSRRLPGSGRTTNEEPTMDKTKVLVALGLPLDTGDETALTALSALAQKAGSLEAEVTALKANQFDPAKHIPLDEHKKVTIELAALKESQDKSAHDQLITAALSDARILPANEAYWRKQPLVALQEFLKDAKPLAALSSTQTGGKPPAGDGNQDIKLSEDEQAVCKSLGLTPEQFAKAKE
jgi:phage I-like protein